jgi:hypothetical protein
LYAHLYVQLLTKGKVESAPRTANMKNKKEYVISFFYSLEVGTKMASSPLSDASDDEIEILVHELILIRYLWLI